MENIKCLMDFVNKFKNYLNGENDEIESFIKFTLNNLR